MQPKADTKLYEQIPHVTDSAPYSIHHTHVSSGIEPALYLHWHREMEFLLLTEGELLFQIEDSTWELHAGEAIFIPSGALHSARNTAADPVSFYALVFSPDFIISSMEASYSTYVLPTLHNNLQYATVFQTEFPWKVNILEHLDSIFFSGIQSELYIRGQILLLWNTLYHNHISKIGIPKVIPTLSEQLAPAIAYIQKNYQQALILDELANCAHLSEGQFCRMFKRFTGMTPFQYLVRYRVLQSCHELSTTDKKITDIAFSHGFNNISYYNRAFLKVMNMTPTKYRAQFTLS